MLSRESIEDSARMNPTNPGPHTMAAATHHVPPTGRPPRPRRKSLEQLEAKYKALMRNMLMYQQMRKRNMCGGAGAGAGTSIKTEAGAAGGRMDEKTQQQQLMFQAQQTLPTPSSSVSPSSSTTNLEEAGVSNQNQPQQQSAHQHHQHHQHPTPALREQRDRPPQKRLQNANSGPKSAYDRREPGSSARHARSAGRPMPAAIQLAYEELTSMQRQHTPPPPQPQQPQQQQQQPPPLHHHQQHQFQQQQQQHHQQQQQQATQQSHQGSTSIPIPRPANIQIPPHYLPQQYIHHVSPHIQHHQPLTSPLPTPPHLTASYTGHHSLPTIPAPYASYDTSGISTHIDQQPASHAHHTHNQQQQQHGLSSYEPNGNVEGDLLDCFVSNMGEM
ncbi:hypothetical protein F5Y03DRAFT_241058 [Xylaria venustula]|nr:hypothetical protein F5Y03DRAFT_241058 [Xylaria venustula]